VWYQTLNAKNRESPVTKEKNTSDTGKTTEMPVVVKKYANRRLYNTASSSYVTLEDLSEMVKGGTDFTVYDAKSGEDITRSVLTQIIFEQEARDGQSLLPTSVLRQLIGYYGNSMQAFVPSYLEASLEAFSKQHDAIRERFTGAFTGAHAIEIMQAMREASVRNMTMFQEAARLMVPFGRDGDSADKPSSKPSSKPAPNENTDELDALKRQMADIQKQLAALSERPKT
jgi:polyhydroxyalkanoate synthesis repressor PhaR